MSDEDYVTVGRGNRGERRVHIRRDIRRCLVHGWKMLEVPNSSQVSLKREWHFAKSLELLGLDYLDLYLIHQPFGDYYGSWRTMTELNRQGIVRAIGVSNFFPDRLVDLIDHNEVTPAIDQVECHPFFQRGDEQRLMRDRGVQIEAWGPFAEGRNNLFSDPTLSEIGSAHGKSVAQVVLRWLLQRDVVVIQKSVRPERMRENMDVFDFELTDDEMACIAALDRGESLFFDHRDPAMVSQIGNRRID